MHPPFDITPIILRGLSNISEKVGRVNAGFLISSSPRLRRQNRIRTIHGSVRIEGNTLSQDQVTAIMENKRVIGPSRDVMEVKNAIRLYDQMAGFLPHDEPGFRRAHGMLMAGLVEQPGRYRRGSVGIERDGTLDHIAPQPAMYPT